MSRLSETLAGLDPEYVGAIGTIVGIVATKLLDGAVALFTASVTTPMRLKALEDSDANIRKEIATNWQRYEEIKKEIDQLKAPKP